MNVFKIIEDNGLNLHGDIEHFAELVRQEGMTLRDYFAAKAMQGMLASGNLPKSVKNEELAVVAYQVADAMLKAREAT